jgi:hypothetical protein
MQPRHASVNESKGHSANSVQILPHKQPRKGRSKSAHQFVYWEREAQLEAFFSWLPQELHSAPGISWERLPPEIMGYCVKTVGNSLEASYIAVAAAATHGAVSIASQRTLLKDLHGFLRDLRLSGTIQCMADLKLEQIWYDWATGQEKKARARHLVTSYLSIATGHMPRYLLRLDMVGRQRMQQYAFPPPPIDLAKRYLPAKPLVAEQQAKRKAETDILTPLYPVLRQLVRFRKQLGERTILTIREARRKIERGEAVLPYHFQHTDTIPDINRDARVISEVQIHGREVTMNFILWDKRTWVEHHNSRYSDESIRLADEGQGPYTQEQNCFFVQLDGPSCNLFWFGDLIEHRLFQHFEKASLHLEGYQERWQLARQLGFSKGCFCSRSGVLHSGDYWFSQTVERGDELIFEAESLYRGILYGSALAMLAFSNGSRMSELLQVSWNKERRITRTESVHVLGEDGQTQVGEDGKPLTKSVKLHFQHLLPKGAKTDEERQLFPLSKEATRLIGEIKMLLEETYGEIPVVAPPRSNTKYEHLVPERYLFQWGASSDEDGGCISSNDVQTLLRLMLHGLDLYTAQGKPIRVSVHVLRHVMATHARHYRNVPPEVVAHFFLHHQLKELTGRTPSLPEISEYYTLMTGEQQFAVINADLDEQEELDHALLQRAPTPRDLEQKNEDIRAMYEVWHALHPTALGNCGCPGLCPRGNDRFLCLGCSYHVEDPEKLGAALVWRTSLATQAELFKAQGNVIDAQQARIKVQFLDDMINVMRMQLEEEAAGRYIPVFKVLPSQYRREKENHEETN